VVAAAVAITGLLLVLQPALASTAQEEERAPVVIVELDGAIDRVSERYLERAIEAANDDGATAIIIELDTPGGLLDSTRSMVGDILASDVPVIVYVSPVGAQAASAGTFISASAAWLAMAPSTNIGAASVVGSGGEDLPDTLDKKVTEDTTAFIRSIAAERDRNADALEATVLDATAYSAREAVEIGIADEIATDIGALLLSLDGRVLDGAAGPRIVVTEGAPIDNVGMSLVEKLLAFIADPNIAFLLISLGSLAVIAEIYTAGLGIAGILGGTALIVGFAGVGNLPFSWAGVALLAASIILFALEAQAPGFGIFGTAGTVTLILGGLFLVGFFGPPDLPGGSPGVNRWILIGVGAFVGLLVILFGREIRKSRHDEGYVSPTSDAALQGSFGQVASRLDPSGEVVVSGEVWEAELLAGGFANVGERVRVAQRRDNCLLVERQPYALEPGQPGEIV
jgi:membrane-bound serine protease (ClpP class)